MYAHKSYEEALDEIRRMSGFFTPEWRFNLSNPDAGTLLSEIWAEMLSGSYDRLELLPGRAEAALLSEMGASRRQAVKARGFLCFTPEPGAAAVIPAGTRVAAADDTDTELVTTSALTAGETCLEAVYEASGELDCLRKLDGVENLRLFEFCRRNERTWSFEHPFAFDVSEGGAIRIRPGFTERGAEYAAMLAEPDKARWEYMTADGFMQVPSVESVSGDIMMRLDGWAPGGSALRLRILEKSVFCDAEICRPRISPQNSGLRPDAVYYGELPLTDSGFFPFGERFMVYDALSIACDEALTKPGAYIELSFSVRVKRVPIVGYPRPEQQYKPIMRPEDIIKIDEREISIDMVAWEYFNGTGWNALPAEYKARSAFSAGELPESRRVCFICPDDICPITVGAHEKSFIRARILSVENAFHMFGWYLSPWIEDLSFGYVCSAGFEPRLLESVQNLESRVYEDCSEPVRLIEELLPENAVYFGFSSPIAKGTALWEMEPGGMGSFPVRFEYFSQRGWQALDTDLADLGTTALMTYAVKQPASALRLFGREAYWIRAVETGASGDGLTKPVLKRLWENAAPAEAASPGVRANGEPGRFSVPVSPIKGLRAVGNPLAVTGGRDEESYDSAVSRCSRFFSHGDRAVSSSDIEHLAKEASPDVISCRCVSNTGPDGRLAHRRDSCLALYASERSAAAFRELAECVGAYILRRYPVHSGRLHIIKPRFILLSAHVSIVMDGSPQTNRERAYGALCRFIDPAEGGPDGTGWPIGSVPSSGQIMVMLGALDSVRYVESAELAYSADGDTRCMEPDELLRDPFILPQNGVHEVTFVEYA